MKLRVECYAGGKADERPIRFQLDDTASTSSKKYLTSCMVLMIPSSSARR